MTTTKTEALEIVAELCADNVLSDREEAILRKALAQPEQRSVSEHLEPVAFVVKQYVGDGRPSIKGNGFDGLEIGYTREEADEFIAWVNAYITAIPQRTAAEGEDTKAGVGLTDEDEVFYPYPPAKPPVYATSKNTKSVRDGYELGGYEKEAGYYSEKQLDEFALAIEAKLKEKNT
jgi:hypothetical protein